MNKSAIRNKKAKYGTMSLLFTVFFICAVIVFNAIFGAVASKLNWYVDMTGEKVFTLSDEAKDYIADVKSEVNIYFAAEPDVLTADSDMRYIYNTAKELAAEFPSIKLECHNVVRDPSFFEKFYISKGTDITTRSVVMECGGESIIYGADAFYTVNDSGEKWAYNGEYRFISGVMQLTQSESPIVYFTTGHSEDVPEEGSGKTAEASTLAQLFYDYGFEVRTIDLTREEISDDARIIVIYNPHFDFVGSEAEKEESDEIRKIDNFLDGLGGLIVFEDPEFSKDLTNLNEFLEEWGIAFRHDTHIKDTEHSMSVDGLSVITRYGEEETFGASVYSDLESFAQMPKSIIRDAMPIEILWEGESANAASRYVSPMIRTYDSAQLISNETGGAIGKGVYDLVTITYESRVIDNDHYYSYVMAAGSPSFAGNNYLVSGAYGNSDIIFSAIKLIGRDRVLADLPFRPFDNTDSSATTEQSAVMTMELTFILPVVVAVCGVVVIIRRRHA